MKALERENRFLEVKILIKVVLELSLSLIMMLCLAELSKTKLEKKKIKIESSKDKFELYKQTNKWMENSIHLAPNRAKIIL